MEFENRTSGNTVRVSGAEAPAVDEAGGIPMTLAAVGDHGRIVKITGNDETRKFLTNLGFTVGSEVTVMSRLGKDLVLDVKGSRIAMNSGAVACLHYIPM